MSGERGKRRKLETRERELSARGAPIGRVLVHEREVGRRQRRAVHRLECKRLRVDLVAAGIVLPSRPSRQPLELERRQVVGEPRLDIGEHEIGGQIARLPVGELHPQPQRTLARIDR